jgi:hypothetical protein
MLGLGSNILEEMIIFAQNNPMNPLSIGFNFNLVVSSFFVVCSFSFEIKACGIENNRGRGALFSLFLFY